MLTLLYQNSQCRNRGRAPTEQSTAYGGSAQAFKEKSQKGLVAKECQKGEMGG